MNEGGWEQEVKIIKKGQYKQKVPLGDGGYLRDDDFSIEGVGIKRGECRKVGLCVVSQNFHCTDARGLYSFIPNFKTVCVP